MRYAREIWEQIVRQYERSGLTQEQFAEERGIPVGTLRGWIYRCRRDVQEEARILPVRVVSSPALTARVEADEGAVIEAVLPDGLRLRFGVGMASAVVVEVLGQLRRC